MLFAIFHITKLIFDPTLVPERINERTPNLRTRESRRMPINCRKCGIRMITRGQPGAGSLASTQQRLASGQGYGGMAGTHGMQVRVLHACVERKRRWRGCRWLMA